MQGRNSNKKGRWNCLVSAVMAVALIACAMGAGPYVRVQAAEENLIKNPNFADGDLSAWMDTGATITAGSQAEAIFDDVKTYATISGRTQSYQGFSQDVTDVVEPGAEYEVSFYVKLSDDYKDWNATERQVFFGPYIVENGSTQYLSQSYSSYITGNLVKTVPVGQWVQLSGTFEVSDGATQVVVRFQEESSGKLGSYSITGVSMKKKAASTTPTLISTYEGPRLRDAITAALGEDAIVGMVTHPVDNKKEWEILTTHANAVTAGNELKPDSHFGYSNATCPGKETVTLNGKKLEVPKIDFSRGNRFVNAVLSYNEAHPDTPIRMRGHVLVWHSQTPEWFFHEDYDSTKPYVTKDVMNQRLEWYIKSILEHYVGADSKYKDLFYGWDVVNEAVSDGGATVYRDESGNSSWWRVYQSNEFIINAFKFANKYAPADVELYYNDYGDASPSKSQRICQLLKDVKEQEGAPGVGTRIDAFGMQAHYSLDDFDVNNFEAAARSYLDIVGKIQLTELDMAASSNYDGTLATQDQEYLDQAICFMNIFETLKKLEKIDGYDVGGITFWGVTDPTSWLQSRSNVGGGQDGTKKQVPLLFDGDYKAKPAFWAFVDPSQIKIEQKQLEFRRQYGEKMENGTLYKFASGKLSAVLKPSWNESGLQLDLAIQDFTIDDDRDYVTIYIDEDGSGTNRKIITVPRSECTKVSGGYKTVVTVPMEDLYLGKQFLFDVTVTDGSGLETSLNDVLGRQSEDSTNYAMATIKAANVGVNKGTVVVDGETEDAWKTAKTIWLNEIVGRPEAAARVKLLWDETKLYLYAEVQDEIPGDQDAIEIYLDEDGAGAPGYASDDKWYRITTGNEVTFNGISASVDKVESVVRKMKNGYVIEASIAWADVTPKPYAPFGLELKVYEADENGSVHGILCWHDSEMLAQATPTVFGKASFYGAGQPAEEEENPDASFSHALAFTGLTEALTDTIFDSWPVTDYNPEDPTGNGAKPNSPLKNILIPVGLVLMAAVVGFLIWRKKKQDKEK